MSELVSFGDAEIILCPKFGKWDCFLPLEKQIQLKIVRGKRFIIIEGFDLNELQELPTKLTIAIKRIEEEIQEEMRIEEKIQEEMRIEEEKKRERKITDADYKPK